MSRVVAEEVQGLDPRISWEELQSGPPSALFEPDLPEGCPVVLEIGFGRGEFILELARANPEVGFLGVEVKERRVLKMAHRISRAGLANLRILHGTGEFLVHEVLPEESIFECWVNFPDPWPKKRHAGRRLVSSEFVKTIRCKLQPGGVLHVATDDEIYAEQIDSVLRAAPGMRSLHAPDSFVSEVPGRKSTAYELEWKAAGRQLRFWDYQKG